MLAHLQESQFGLQSPHPVLFLCQTTLLLFMLLLLLLLLLMLGNLRMSLDI